MKLPSVTPHAPHAHAAWARRHPQERQFVGRSVALSIGIHLLFVAMVCLLALWLDHVTFSHGSSIAQSGPAPDQTTTLKLVMPAPHPAPPPTPQPKPYPEPSLPVLPTVTPIPKPPMSVTLVPPAPKSVSAPTPQSVVPVLAETKVPTSSRAKTTPKPSTQPHPKYTAAQAAGEGKTPGISSEQLAKLGYPAPNYPPEAQTMHQTGTVLMEVGFGPDGRVKIAQVRHSSGFPILDTSTQKFIRVHWKDLSRANTTIDVPILYTLE